MTEIWHPAFVYHAKRLYMYIISEDGERTDPQFRRV